MIPERLVRLMTLGFLYVTAASLVLTLFLTWPGVRGGPANLVDMVGGTAKKPFVCRLLLPSIVRLSSAAAARAWSGPRSERGRRGVEEVGSFMLRHTHAPARAFDHARLYGVYSLSAFLCFIGFALVLRALLRWFYRDYPPRVADFAPIAAFWSCPRSSSGT
jgi:hypothetical protein